MSTWKPTKCWLTSSLSLCSGHVEKRTKSRLVSVVALPLPSCSASASPSWSSSSGSWQVITDDRAAKSKGLIHTYVLSLTGHWLLMDAMGMGLCVAFIAFVRLPSLKVSTLLLSGLLLYDVFWVFFSQYVFSANVMVKVCTCCCYPTFLDLAINWLTLQVATRPADNPVGAMARKFHLGGHMAHNAPRLSLPGKLVFPSTHNTGHFSMLGLGDIVMPGLLLCFVMRYDAYKRAQVSELLLFFPHQIQSKHTIRYTIQATSVIDYIFFFFFISGSKAGWCRNSTS